MTEPGNDDRPVFITLLGASNLTLSLRPALEHVIARLPGRLLTVRVAHGPGRSYGTEAGVPGVAFRGISQCGIFDALDAACAARRPSDHWALLTDIGNDILYRAGVARVAAWVEHVVERLLQTDAHVGITSLPVESIENLSPAMYRILRPLFFPFRPMPRGETLRQVRRLQECIEQIASQRRVRLLETRTEWYGVDHFHLRRSARPRAVASWLDAVMEKTPEPAVRPAAERHLPRLALRFAPPEDYRLFGRRRFHVQTGTVLIEGVTLFRY